MTQTQRNWASSILRHRGALLVLGAWTLLAIVLVGAAVLVPDEHADIGAAAEPQQLGHIHGMAEQPDGDGLVLGAHYGVFLVEDDGRVRALGERRSDTMALTDHAGGQLLASGHPDLTTSAPLNAGLLLSEDGAATWRPVALEGVADFHALDASGDTLWGIDAASGRLMVSTPPGKAWVEVADTPLLDIAVDPDRPQQVLASGPGGSLSLVTADGDTRALSAAPAVALLDWTADAGLVAVSPSGEVLVSPDGGTTWHRRGQVPGEPTALTLTPAGWYVATSAGLFGSTDGGRGFQALFRFTT